MDSLKKAIGCSSLTYDELATLITEIEAVLNSQPLTFVSADNREEPLTPSHLLCGYRILSLPDPVATYPNDTTVSIVKNCHGEPSTFKRLFLTFGKVSIFWNFVSTSRATRGVKENVKIGAVVTIYDEYHPRGLWRLGVVEELVNGVDGETRGAKVRVVSKTGRPSVLRRPIQHLYPSKLTEMTLWRMMLIV